MAPVGLDLRWFDFRFSQFNNVVGRAELVVVDRTSPDARRAWFRRTIRGH